MNDEREREWRRDAEHAVRYPTIIVGSTGPSPATRLGEAVLTLLARLDAERAAKAEAWKLIGAYLHAEIDKDIHRDDRTYAKRWLDARDAVISGHDAYIAASSTDDREAVDGA